jgi:transcriptional regulator with XRE-family HTH domain
MDINTTQLRAARGALQWSQRQLARRLGLNFSTMSYYENGLEMPEERMRQTIALFEEQGIVFIRNDQGRGVILKNAL